MASLYNKELLYRSLCEGMDSREQAILDHYIKHKVDEAVECEKNKQAIKIDAARDTIKVCQEITESEKNLRMWALFLLLPVYSAIAFIAIKLFFN